MSMDPATLTRRQNRERAKRPSQHTDREMRRIMSKTLPMAKNGCLREMRYFSEGVVDFSEFIIPEVFEAFLEHLQAPRVPPVETTPSSLDRSFKDIKVQRAKQALQGLGHAFRFLDLIYSKPEIGDLIVARWPDVLAWMWYFYISCFENNHGSRGFKVEMFRSLCLMFAVGCIRDQCTLAIAEVPGSVRLATFLCMFDPRGDLLNKEVAHLGAYTLVYFMQVEITTSLLDEVLEALGGSTKLFIDTAIARLECALDDPESAAKTLTTHVPFILSLDSPKVAKHPICAAFRARNPIGILTNVVCRVLDILPVASSGQFGPDCASGFRHIVSTVLAHISSTLRRDSTHTKQALQAIQAGIMSALMDCAPLAFTFQPFDRDSIVDVLKQLTWLTTHLPIARQASAELERLESTCSVQGRFNAATLDVRKAWVTLYDAILARRSILSQMQALESTPMTCDNCFRFDERANFKKCAGCGKAHYCSRDCQSRAWKEKGHRDECKSLKNKPEKSRRTSNHEKYFLARVAINDAQHKKEQLKQMADLGLEKLSVLVDYTEFPPRCLVEFDAEELLSFSKETTIMVETTGRWLDRCKALFSQLPEASVEVPQQTSYVEVPIPKELSCEAKVEDLDDIEVIRIQLVDGDVQATGLPPIHLSVRLPANEGTLVPRKERFVIDDFWEFMHIKFEDTKEADPSEILQEKEEEKTKYTVARESFTPEIQELMQMALTRESRKASAEKALAGLIAQQQDHLSKLIKSLSDTRSEVVNTMMEVSKIMSKLNLPLT
ncbi:hypothetical protein SCHPADRAFT_1001891 [Schizopora paradoxa]|uniref:MYND-type domain-containing protein n=1 Tax=Schizopora paradoxa TaxID=27342 RepID=A0A0H2RQM8_9AGAM|nr:hypothetical protein SCHPADRAFT_1001891 [Schizopora paradoxa]